MGDIESYHLYSVILSAVLVGTVVYFTSSIYGLFAGIVAGLSLFLYPLFFGESRFNIKDPPETVYYAISAIIFYRGITVNNWKWILVSSIFAGLAFGTKLNIIFLYVSIVLWLCLYWGSVLRQLSLGKFIQKYKKVLIMIVLFPVVPVALYFISWPILWEDPFNRVLYNISYYKSVGLGSIPDPRFSFFGINMYAPAWILYTTPLTVLAFSLVGIFWTFRFGFKEENKTSLFLLFWFLVPIARVMFPGAGIYGGVRQIMEYIPALAILSGIGASAIVAWLHSYIVKNKLLNHLAIKPLFLLQLLIILSFLPITLKLISLHPNESIYFNSIIGGLKGAKDKNIPGWGNSLGSTYRQAVKWFNEHVEPNAKLALIYELRSNIPSIDLRPDINFSNQFRSSLERKGEYIIGVTHEGASEDRFHRKYLERFLIPVHEIIVDDVAVLKIWKNDLERTKPGYNKEEKITDFSIIKDKNFIKIDLKRIIPVTRIYIYYNQSDCMPPTDGYFEYSFNGHIWKRDIGDFAPETATKLSGIGVFRYLFAAERARFFQAIIADKNSCLLKGKVKIEVYKI